MFKVLDHRENIKKLKRGQSAYKRHLIERLLEKGDRAKDIQQRRNRLSDLAMQNQIQTKSQFRACMQNIDSLDRNYRMDLNIKNLLNAEQAKPKGKV